MNNEEIICRKVSELLAGKDWHRLTIKEREIVADLEQAGWLTRNNPTNGFVGKAV